VGRPPAEADLQRHFNVAPPSVHAMMLSLGRAGLIQREPKCARTIAIMIDRTDQPVKIAVQEY